MNEQLLVARAERTTYENIEAACPNCGRTCVLNRRSDLKTRMPVAGKEVPCTECGTHFWLTGDTVNASYESILYDCVDLLRLKRYMLSVVGACQAYEMFFGLYLRVELVYEPFGRECQGEQWPPIESLNDLSKALRRKVKGRAFDKLRARFLRQVICEAPPLSCQDAELAIDSLARTDRWKRPKQVQIQNASVSETLKPLLLGVAKTKVHELRNKVVHQRGYRPSREEAESAVNEASSLLFPLGSKLELREDINWYTMRASE